MVWSTHLSNNEKETRELMGASHQELFSRHICSRPLAEEPSVKKTIALDLNRRSRTQRNKHRRARIIDWDAPDSCFEVFWHQFVVGATHQRQHAIRIVFSSSYSVGKRLGHIVILEYVFYVEVDKILKVLGGNSFSDCGRQLIIKHFFDVVHGEIPPIFQRHELLNQKKHSRFLICNNFFVFVQVGYRCYALFQRVVVLFNEGTNGFLVYYLVVFKERKHRAEDPIRMVCHCRTYLRVMPCDQTLKI
mmetsp:Transcript_11568/g.33274  ORF Transcript_11568/g.33274 Transcript_11568/m.33274 type:complete len:247 (+) Transcript_11568:501-1241(+)